MGLLYDLETRLEQQMPVRLQQALGDCQPLCPDCGLAMCRHHWYARTITTHYGAIRLRMPAFRRAVDTIHARKYPLATLSGEAGVPSIHVAIVPEA